MIPETLYVPEEFAVKGNVDPMTQLALMMRTIYNPVPALAVAKIYLDGEGVEIDDETYGKVMQGTLDLAATHLWEELVADSFRKNREGIIPNAEKVYDAHRSFITILVQNLRAEGYDIPAQSWETKSETEPLEIKEEN